MLSASCPSCAAPVVFKSTAATTVVCAACSSAVAREGDDLRALGKVSSFARDLSPLQVGVRGEMGSRGFEIVGVLRKAREGVRWNEWYLLFDDGQSGWIGEGNGEFSLYDRPLSGGVPAHSELSPSKEVTIHDVVWVVNEASHATIIAAEGELPFAPDGQSRGYADLRSRDGKKVATADFSDDPVSFWVGHLVPLTSLSLTGLRNFTGWTDPVLTQFAGPEVTSVRALQCPSCAAPIQLRAPGDAKTVCCAYCGAGLDIGEGEQGTIASVVSGPEDVAFKPVIELGSKGKLHGVEWEVIGAMVRFVNVQGISYDWTEYFLHNPYRGFAWLAHDGGSHWNFIERCTEFPVWSAGRVTYKGDTYKKFQRGTAYVRWVLGEFTWQVKKGDSADTDDWTSPPFSLSSEKTKEEVVWTRGTYTPPEHVEGAFGITARQPTGVSINQPNPHQDGKRDQRMTTNLGVLLMAVVLLFVLGPVLYSSDVLVEQTFTPGSNAGQVWLTKEFTVPDSMRRDVKIKVDSDIHRGSGQVHVALINQDSGTVYFAKTSSNSNNDGTAIVARPKPGAYVGRVEVASSGKNTLGKKSVITIQRAPPWRTPVVLLLFYAMMGPMLGWLLSWSFETRRWAESDYPMGS